MENADKSKKQPMDDTLDDTFPASDPPAWTTPKEHSEKDIRKKSGLGDKTGR